MEKNKRLILSILEEKYGERKTALVFRNPFELLVATILSAQSTDNQVNRITAKLFSQYPTPEDILTLKEEALADKIKGVGLYRNKARHILAATEILIKEYQGQVPPCREELMRLPGVGRKTANVVLANAYGIPALGVDTHVFRVANRLGLARGKKPLEVEEQLMKLLPEEKWIGAHRWLIWHGRLLCKARNPLCADCPLRDLCPEKQGGESDGAAC